MLLKSLIAQACPTSSIPYQLQQLYNDYQDSLDTYPQNEELEAVLIAILSSELAFSH
jgi:hypothetical protein